MTLDGAEAHLPAASLDAEDMDVDDDDVDWQDASSRSVDVDDAAAAMDDSATDGRLVGKVKPQQIVSAESLMDEGMSVCYRRRLVRGP